MKVYIFLTSERAMALIRISHPDFRQQLKEDAVDNNIITQAQANNIPAQ